MVAAAEQGEVVEVGGSAAGPVVEVVGVAPWVGAVAAGEDAARVAVDEGAALRGGDDTGAAAEVEDLRHTVHEHAPDVGVAAEPEGGFGGDGGAGSELAADLGEVGGEFALQGRDVDDDVDADRGAPGG